MDPADDATIEDAILNAANPPARGTPEFNKKVTEITNNLRKLIPELKNTVQNEIVKHIQASNRPTEGNGRFVSNFVTFDDLMPALLTPCQSRAQAFYARFYKGEGFLPALETMEMSLASMELEPKQYESHQVNTFERFLQHAVHQIHHTRE